VSEQLIILVPVDPHFQPVPKQADRAVDLLKTIVSEYDRIGLKISAKPQFFNGMENFESVHCPGTFEPIDMEWWGDMMDKDFDGEGFRLAIIETPCGQSGLTLNDLEYQSPCAFGVFGIEIANPNIRNLPEADQKAVGQVLGCAVRQIFAHI
jgi:hypothetical protein